MPEVVRLYTDDAAEEMRARARGGTMSRSAKIRSASDSSGVTVSAWSWEVVEEISESKKGVVLASDGKIFERLEGHSVEFCVMG